jgi:transcriptional regulator with XRE-family HTH domain
MNECPSPIPMLRSVRGVAQADHARAVGISPATLSNLETGRRRLPADLRELIAVALAAPPEVVAGGNFTIVVANGQVRIES